ncbi:MAG: hypothetical protein FWD61_14240, partial [Phycisphaerales bacterium]|nr:hypothetical protein [Phycisphaerales bacterium]
MSIVMEEAELGKLVATDVSKSDRNAAGSEFSERVCRLLQEKIGSDRYDLWFDRKTRLALVGNALVIEAGNAFSADWIRRKFLQELAAAAREAAGRMLEVSVVVGEAVAIADVGGSEEICKPERSPVAGGGGVARAAGSRLRPLFHPRFTLAGSGVGPPN